MSISIIDLTNHLPVPKLDVPSAVAVGAALLAGVPASAGPGVVQAGRHLRGALLELQARWAEKERPVERPVDPRPVDATVDAAWGASARRLEAMSALPVDRYPNAARAQRLLDRVFPDGLGFLTLPYPSEWAECEKRLALIAAEKLEPELDALAGPDFLAELKRAHVEYTKVVQGGLLRAAAPTASLLEPLRAVARAMAVYITQVVASAAEEHPETVAVAAAALRPIAAFREQQQARRAARQGATPTPELPAGTPTTPLPEVE